MAEKHTPLAVAAPVPADSTSKKIECFVMMPFSSPSGYCGDHFTRVYEDLIIPACDQAGMKPDRCDDSPAANLIHVNMIKRIINAPMAICDLSSRNPNVLFELGIRQAFDKPVCLIQEDGEQRIFDVAGINTITYRKERLYHQVIEDQQKICRGLKDTYESAQKGELINSLLKLASISPANLPVDDNRKRTPELSLIYTQLDMLMSEIRNLKDQTSNSLVFSRSINLSEIVSSDLHSPFKYEEDVNNAINEGTIPIQLFDAVKNQYNLWNREYQKTKSKKALLACREFGKYMKMLE